VSTTSPQEVRIIIAGGGTGGHVFPALAVRQAIAQRVPNARVVFVGTRHGLEAVILPKRNEALRTLWISGFARRSLLRNAFMPLKLVVSFFQSLRLLTTFRPHVVIGTGGYVMGPVLWTAQALGIPTVLQEQNSLPGYTTRKLARKASAVCAGFEDAKKHLSGANVIVTGNPLRSEFSTVDRAQARQRWDLDYSRKTVLIFGGSAGARRINEAIAPALTSLLSLCNVIWQTGKIGLPESMDLQVQTSGTRDKRLIIREFIDDMAGAYAVSDLAICRAGAMTLAELAVAGLPAILIPYPFATDDHQTANASSAVNSEAAELLADRDLSPEQILDCVRNILQSDEKLQRLAANMKTLARPNAADCIAEIALSLVKAK
jgi:UDP-N-acetylglucosamine--N-acetylmuramyl-(pentapeptide) pyrophosphoryl-undecaprenol N-acetylglucosamine transferase